MTTEPEDFIVRFRERIRTPADVLDVGCGRGRHAVYLARAGRRVWALDRSLEALGTLREVAEREGLPIETIPADVEKMSLLPAGFDAVVNTLFLYRDLFPHFCRALRPGGLLMFRTFTTDHADVLRKERPSRRYLLEPGELRHAFPELVEEYYDESIQDGRAMATLVASKQGRVTE